MLMAQQIHAQPWQAPAGQVEVFCGATLGYADNNWLRLYDVHIDATPGLRWHLGHDWTVAAQGLIPVVNEGYTYRDWVYKYWRVNMATVSRQLHFTEARQHLKFTVGLFGSERYGVDARWMWPVTSWLLLQAQAGLTASWIMGTDFRGNYDVDMKGDFTLTGMAGANVYLRPWDIELRLSGGRYTAGDYGIQFDVMRHFKHCTLLAFARMYCGDRQVSSYDRYHFRTNGGFKVIMMLPPYKKSSRKLVVRPASNFRLTNNMHSNEGLMQLYTTDPEENERELQVDVDWGQRKVKSEE